MAGRPLAATSEPLLSLGFSGLCLGAEDPTRNDRAGEDGLAPETVVEWLRERDRALTRLNFSYEWIGPADENGAVETWDWIQVGRRCVRGGTHVEIQWGIEGGGSRESPRWISSTWSAFDGATTETVDAIVPEEKWVAEDPRDCLLGLLGGLPGTLLKGDILALDDSPHAGAFRADVIGLGTGLFAHLEPWSRFLSRVDMRVLGVETVEGRECVGVLFDRADASEGIADGRWEWPHRVWFDLETMVAVQWLGFVNRDQWKRGGHPLDPEGVELRPESLDESWIPLRRVRVSDLRRLDTGVWIGTRAAMDCVSGGSPYPASRVRFFDFSTAAPDPCCDSNALPVTYPLTIVDEVRDLRYVVASPQDQARYTLFDISFARAVQMVMEEEGSGHSVSSLDLEHVPLRDASCIAGVALCLARARGDDRPMSELIDCIPEPWRTRSTSLSHDTPRRLLEKLGFEPTFESESCGLDGIRAMAGWFIAHLAEGRSAERSLHFALCRVQEEDPLRMVVLQPGRSIQTWNREEFERAWSGRITRVAKLGGPGDGGKER